MRPGHVPALPAFLTHCHLLMAPPPMRAQSEGTRQPPSVETALVCQACYPQSRGSLSGAGGQQPPAEKCSVSMEMCGREAVPWMRLPLPTRRAFAVA